MPSAALVNFWRTDLTRDCFLSVAARDDLPALRLVCRDFNTHATPVLFNRIQISFHANTFSRLARVTALERIGHHVKSLTFNMPHGPEVFLPPVLDPVTGEEKTFVYQPQADLSRPSSSESRSSLSKSKYGSWELTDLLVKQYPPLFHAATNITSFTRAFQALPNLRSLHVSCPDQPSAQRYRRDIVDYALISLRIALEQARPPHLSSLALSPIHPAAVVHLGPHFSIGACPASTLLWRQITDLTIEMDSFTFGPDYASDHLKILHAYLSSFKRLESLNFKWAGATKGPCPLSLDAEPCTSRPTSLDCSTACPEASKKPSCRPLQFRQLKSMRLQHATLDATQVSSFIMLHRKVLHEFDFDECTLRSGTWEDALAPLTKISGSDAWKKQQARQEKERASVEVMEVPIVLSPVDEKRECIRELMWDDERKKSRGLQMIRKMSMRTKEALGGISDGHMVKKLLRHSMLKWH